MLQQSRADQSLRWLLLLHTKRNQKQTLLRATLTQANFNNTGAQT
jgi:hypothetical protein